MKKNTMVQKKVFGEIITENFPKLMKDINPQTKKLRILEEKMKRK